MNRLRELLRNPKMADSPSVTFKSPGICPCIRLPSPRFEAALPSLARHLDGLSDRANFKFKFQNFYQSASESPVMAN